jgi:hypothetical protein
MQKQPGRESTGLSISPRSEALSSLSPIVIKALMDTTVTLVSGTPPNPSEIRES